MYTSKEKKQCTETWEKMFIWLLLLAIESN